MKLATLTVEFLAKGVEGVKTALGNTKSQTELVKETIKKTGEVTEGSFKKAADRIGGAAEAVKRLAGGFEGAGEKAKSLTSRVNDVAKAVHRAVAAFAMMPARGVSRAEAVLEPWSTYEMRPAQGQSKAGANPVAIQQVTAAIQQQTAAVRGLTAEQFRSLRPVVEARRNLDVLKERLNAVAEGMGRFSRMAAVGFAAASAALGGFIRAGLQSTAVGDYLSFRMGELSRNIAGLFRPEIEKVIGAITSMVQWFRSLSDAQRESIVHWVEASLAALAVAMVLPKVIIGISALVGVVKLLTGAQLALEAATAATSAGILLVAAAIAYLVVGTETGRAALAKLSNIISGLNFEAVQAFLKWTAFGIALGGIIIIVPKVVAAIRTMIVALRALRTAEILAMAVTPAGLAAMVAGLAVAGGIIAGLAAAEGSEDDGAKKGKGPGKGPRSELLPSAGGLESVDAAWRRIAEKSSTLGMRTPAEEHLDEAKKQTGILEDIRDDAANKRPIAVGAR